MKQAIREVTGALFALIVFFIVPVTILVISIVCFIGYVDGSYKNTPEYKACAIECHPYAVHSAGDQCACNTAKMYKPKKS